MKVIILHGWSHNGQLWQNLASKFPDALALDMPGFGNEPLILDDWGIPEYAKWVEKKVSKYNNIILIGHSFGGRIAAEIASTNPKYLKGLILSGAPCIYRPSHKTKLKIKVYKSLKVFLPADARKIFYSGDLKSSGHLEKIFRKVIAYDQTKQLQKINVPTLLIWGGNDDQVPVRIAEEIHNLIGNSKLKIIEGSGHNAYLEKPDLFYGYVKNFISNL